MWRVALGLLACALLFAAAFLWPSPGAHTGFPLDDAWIHMVYARNLLSGHGLAYNVGQLETGLTAPLWTVLLVPLHAIGGEPARVVWLVRALGVMLMTITAWLAARTLIAFHVMRSVALVAAVAIVLDPYGMLGALSGMEVPLTALLLIWVLHALAHDNHAHATAALILLPLARPESLLLVLVIVSLLFAARRDDSPRWHGPALMLLPWLGWLCWCGYCLSVSSYPLPSTFYAKASPSFAAWVHNAKTLPAMWIGFGWFHSLVGIALSAWGIVCLWNSATTQRAPMRAALRVFALLVPTYVLAVCASQPLKEALTFYWMRYVLPAVPASLMLIAVGFDQLWKRRNAGLPQRLLWLLPVTMLAGWAFTVPTAIHHYLWSCQNIADAQIVVATWLRDHTAQDEWIATNDAGAIAYFSDRRVLDLVGLNNHRVVHGGLAGEIARTHPRYFAVFPAWFPMVERDRRFTRVYSARADHYVISSAAQDQLVVYRFDR